MKCARTQNPDIREMLANIRGSSPKHHRSVANTSGGRCIADCLGMLRESQYIMEGSGKHPRTFPGFWGCFGNALHEYMKNTIDIAHFDPDKTSHQYSCTPDPNPLSDFFFKPRLQFSFFCCIFCFREIISPEFINI